MLPVQKFLVLLTAVLSIESLAAQPQSVQDSLLLEKAFKTKDSKLVGDLLNRWHLEDLTVQRTDVADSAQLVEKIYEFFIHQFLKKQLQGYYHHSDRKPDGSSYGGTGLCRFELQHVTFLFVQDRFRYGQTNLNIAEADFSDYVKWKNDDNGLMPKSVADTSKLYALDGHSFGNKKPEHQSLTIINYSPSKEFLAALQTRHGYKGIVWRYNTERQKRLVRFLGYHAMGPGFISTDENSFIYRQRKDRIHFLNETLKLGDDLEYLIAGHYAIELNSVTFITHSSLALLKYSVGPCSYLSLIDLTRLDDKAYIPLSAWIYIS